ncbi:MAG TPA: MBOAT family protein [Candidatus Copromorpha excrementigallinarum]|uniref:MBOAT family protein n=1 Tax=Candidatus Allocopromorpha excrementigallinarum TaxID=2840742 RepID=A0A9D1I1P1_9FIRM|nr:MBOAT family protein [Candidatus Copromorpha excrementigallinarum]
MAFTSFYFLIFAALVICVYYSVPKKGRWLALLAASYAFYLMSSPRTFLFVLFTTVITFFGGRYIGRQNSEHKAYLQEHKDRLSKEDKKALKASVQKKKRQMAALILVANFGVLAAVKYFAPFIEALGVGKIIDLGILIPLGISFYTFQTAAYIIDLYRGKIEADSSILKFALFVSFFPQMVQGPISRYDQLAGQLYEGHDFSYRNISYGAQLVLWGFFKKLVIADRAAILVNQVFDNYDQYQGGIVFVALLLYTVQIYGDFSGGIDIARGIAAMLGIDMAHNFMRPYFSDSISEFWRRWHMSLSFWCRDYIFFSISLSKSFGKAGKRLRSILGDRVGKLFPVLVAQMATFLTIGLWHGAEFKYIAYGLYNGGIIILGLLLEPYLRKLTAALHINVEGTGWKLFRILRTFFLIVIGRMFPRAASFGVAIAMFGSIFKGGGNFSGEIFALGLDAADFVILLGGCVIWSIISYRQEKGIKIREDISRKPLALRWLLFLGAFAAVVILGVYGPGYDAGAFIYRGF